MSGKRTKIGIWLIGACGGIGSTVALGLAALKKKLTSPVGMVTEMPEFAGLGLVGADNIVFGGHEVRDVSMVEAVRSMHVESQIISAELIKACSASVRAMQKNVRPGVAYGVLPAVAKRGEMSRVRKVSSPGRAVAVVRDDLLEFKRKHRLDHVVVINVSATEPPMKRHASHATYAKLAKELGKSGSDAVPNSALYALGAFSADCSYVNFTPSVGMNVPAIEEFARQRDVVYMGRDGKTGETLLKSVLAPMFAMRNLRLMSWVGHNVLGNSDGANLADPAVKVSKIKSKDQLVGRIVGYSPLTHTSIEYVPSLNDWKVAWDFIHFEGFLETKMNMQFVWTGSDSILAAPLVIDLARLAAWEYASGRRGRMDHLACFFKDPDGSREHNLFHQWSRLMGHIETYGDGA